MNKTSMTDEQIEKIFKDYFKKDDPFCVELELLPYSKKTGYPDDRDPNQPIFSTLINKYIDPKTGEPINE